MLKSAIRLLLPLFVVGLLFSACDRKKTEDYSKTILNIPNRARSAAREADLEALKSTIKAYRATNGRYPKDLTAVVPLLGSPVDLSNYDYDPATGTVSLKTTR